MASFHSADGLRGGESCSSLYTKTKQKKKKKKEKKKKNAANEVYTLLLYSEKRVWWLSFRVSFDSQVSPCRGGKKSDYFAFLE